MIEVLNQVDNVITSFNKSVFVENMLLNKKIINRDHLLENGVDLNNNIVHSYIENQNMLDLYVMYINKEINKLLDNKYCGK